MQYVLRVPTLLAFALALSALLVPRVGLAAQVNISIMDNFFAPNSVTVAAGDTVVWKNNGSTGHTIQSDDGTLNTGLISPGQTFAVTFSAATGLYRYHDQNFGTVGGGGMAATITIAATAPTPVATPVPTPVYTAPVYTTPTSNPSIAQLQAQVQTLLAQIQALQGSIGQGSTITTTSTGSGVSTYSAVCPQISRSLKFGASGDDVSRLQQFLARDSAVYPEAQVTGYYGALTQAAVQKWQAKYNIVSSGTPDSTGYGVVGPRTAAAISIICAGGTLNGVSMTQGASSPVGGFISVTPVSGIAPLTVNVSATVNTTNSCAGATYTLNFGDNTAPQLIPAPTGNCGQLQQVYQHVYQYGGSYTVTLSAGSHSTTATVSVAGPAGPLTTTTSTTPAGTISAFVTSGTAPLTTTFYVSCVAGVAYNVVFGDGQDLGGTSVGQTKCDGSLQAVTHTYTSAGSYQAQLIIFVTQANGTVASQKWGTVQISTSGNQSSGSTGSYSYTTPLVQSSGANSLAFSVQFDLPSSCTGYDLSWGDGSANVTQSDGGTSCAQSSVAKTFSHTYASSGSYTIVLKRGAALARTDDVSITISQ